MIVSLIEWYWQLSSTIPMNMKNIIVIFLGLFLAYSCQQKEKSVFEKPVSEFNLLVDLANFKQRMSEVDTIRISFDHSICTYAAYERLEITRLGDSIQIRSEYQDHDDSDKEWKSIYSKNIAVNDTVWDFLGFIQRNDSLVDSIPLRYTNMVISHGVSKVSYSTKGLVNRMNFQRDYNQTMRRLYDPEGFIYGYTQEEIDEMNEKIEKQGI